MSPNAAIKAIAAGRVLLGTSLVLFPRLAAGSWIGRDGRREAVTVLARALGARDAFMGLMTLHTVDRPEVGVRWARACAVIDAIDGAATVAARGSLPAPAALGVGLIAFGSAAAEAVLSTRLVASEPPAGAA